MSSADVNPDNVKASVRLYIYIYIYIIHAEFLDRCTSGTAQVTA